MGCKQSVEKPECTICSPLVPYEHLTKKSKDMFCCKCGRSFSYCLLSDARKEKELAEKLYINAKIVADNAEFEKTEAYNVLMNLENEKNHISMDDAKFILVDNPLIAAQVDFTKKDAHFLVASLEETKFHESYLAAVRMYDVIEAVFTNF